MEEKLMNATVPSWENLKKNFVTTGPEISGSVILLGCESFPFYEYLYLLE